MKDFLHGLAHLIAILALVAFAFFGYSAGYSKGAADTIISFIKNAKKYKSA